MQSTEAIVNYIRYLRENAGLMVSIHFHITPKAYELDAMEEFRAHNHPYCAYVRRTKEAHWACLECQRKAAAKCRKEGAYAGVCHAGVFEYVYPIVLDGKIDGMLSVSGYAASDGADYVEKLCVNYDMDVRFLYMAYDVLNKNVPPKEDVDTLIYPLLNMMELLSYKQKAKGAPSASLPQRIIGYCNIHYLKKITSETICREFFCSRSYVAHMFKKETGKSLPDYLNHLRIETAKRILESSDVHVSEVASLSGFEDRSHFSKCFKQETNCTPREWRNQHK